VGSNPPCGAILVAAGAPALPLNQAKSSCFAASVSGVRNFRPMPVLTYEHMFWSTPSDPLPSKPPIGAGVLEPLTAAGRAAAAKPAPTLHPHRRFLAPAKRHRVGSIPAAPQLCTSPVHGATPVPRLPAWPARRERHGGLAH
jgi:hypothetical protein